MNIFVLCTGRCGSTTFVRAAKHIANFTAGHETRTMFPGGARFAYPGNHIEADNRLSWLLGRLNEIYGDDAHYVHLRRDILGTAQSFRERWDSGIMKAYRAEILMGAGKHDVPDPEGRLAYCIDYCETVDSNIRLFLKDKSNKIDFRLENARNDWLRFWAWVGAEGDLDGSLKEWLVQHNARK